MVETSGLENRQGASPRGFESHLLRLYKKGIAAFAVLSLCVMASMPIFEWDGKEYEFEERGSDWYWALGIISAAAILTSILFGNILLALVILAGAITVGLQAAKAHHDHHFAIYEDGLAIDDDLYLYEDMRDFAVLEYLDETLPPALSIKTNHILAPHLLIPIHDYDPVEVYEYISQHLPEGMHEETLIERITALLRF